MSILFLLIRTKSNSFRLAKPINELGVKFSIQMLNVLSFLFELNKPFGKYSKWLPLKFKEARLVKFRNEFLLILVIKFPLRSNEVRLSKFLSASGYIDVRVMLLK